MPENRDLDAFLSGPFVDEAVFALRPNYRSLLIAVDGLVPVASVEDSNAMLQAPEDAALAALEDRQVEEIPHVAAWREAHRAFGAKPSAPATASRRGVRLSVQRVEAKFKYDDHTPVERKERRRRLAEVGEWRAPATDPDQPLDHRDAH
jgi:hypothetical protein